MAPTFLRRMAVALLGLSLSACGSSSSSSKQPLTEHQRDSVIAGSTLPGAATVGKALEHQGDATRREASLDSLTQ